MKKTIISLSFASVALLLTSCNTMEKKEIETAQISPAYDSQINRVIVYKSRAALPKHSKIIGPVVAQNYNLDGSKASPATILLELKRQAALQGGHGIVHIMKGTAQTTADVVL